MINDYSDHAANERTFLAWLRTGLSVVAFGFVVQKLNVPVAAASTSTSSWFTFDGTITVILAAFGRYDGLALSLIGIVLILVGGLRFARTARDIVSPDPRRPGGTRTELLLTVALAFLSATLCAYLSTQ
jgi:putative membrane protein